MAFDTKDVGDFSVHSTLYSVCILNKIDLSRMAPRMVDLKAGSRSGIRMNDSGLYYVREQSIRCGDMI